MVWVDSMMNKPEREDAETARIRHVVEEMLELHKNADFAVTNRMLRALCHWLIVSQVVLLVTAIGTAIGAYFRGSFPWSGTLIGLIIGWPLAQIYIYLVKKKWN